MTVNELIQDLEYFRNEYGNLDVMLGTSRVHEELEEVSVYYEDTYPISVYYEDTYPSYVILTP